MSYTPHYLTLTAFQSAVESNVGEYIDDMLAQVGSTSDERDAYCRDTIIKNAESFVDGYISAVRETPVASTSQYYGMIQDWVLIVARYKIELLGAGSRVREKLREEYEDLILTLKDVARGNFKITDDDGDGPGDDGVSFASTSDTADFTVGTLGAYF